MDENKGNTFKKLAAIDVSSYIKQKGKLDYLPWARGWKILKEHYSNATYKVILAENGLPYIYSKAGYMVFTEVCIDGFCLPCHLPVLDYYNKALKEATMFDINSAIMRCLAKNIALHGLGISLFVTEESYPPEPKEGPKAVQQQTPTPTQQTATNSDNSNPTKCPQCESELVERNGKNGPFLACPGYPDCKYTHNVLKKPAPKNIEQDPGYEDEDVPF